MADDFPTLMSRAMSLGMPPPPPGYGRGADAPDWYPADTFTGRRYELWRLRSVMWQTLQKVLATRR